MEIKRSGSQPSGKGPADYFTGAVRMTRWARFWDFCVAAADVPSGKTISALANANEPCP
jgi:hypothetical protein